MKRVIKHIEQLLYKQECVVVPGLGAFIRHQRSAETDPAKGLIYPGRSEISFNAALSQNDGLLVQSYSDAFSFGYKRARTLLESDVRELQTALSTHGIVQMGEIGKLMQDRTDGRITFIPNPDHPFSIEYYGLAPVAMLPHLDAERSGIRPGGQGKRKGDVYYLPINLRTMKYGAVAAVFTALALLIPSAKLSDPSVEKLQYQAGFLSPRTTPIEKSEAETPVVNFSSEIPMSEETDIERMGSLKVLRTPIGMERYYIVVASLENERQMDKFMRTNGESLHGFTNAGVIISPTYHRIYTDSFDTIEEARIYLNELIQNPAFATSWIYKSK